MGEHIVIELGEKVKLKGTDAEDGDRFHITGGAAIADSSQDLAGKSIELVGAQLGRTHVSYGPDLSETLTGEEKFAGRGATRSSHDEWDIEVVPKGAKKEGTQAAPDSPLASSNVHEGLLPMSEVQEEPSEKTPYGMDQENKPVAPHPSMTAGGAHNVAKQSEDAEATGPTVPVADEKKRGKKKRK